VKKLSSKCWLIYCQRPTIGALKEVLDGHGYENAIIVEIGEGHFTFLTDKPVTEEVKGIIEFIRPVGALYTYYHKEYN
jgi:hypothetical protein